MSHNEKLSNLIEDVWSSAKAAKTNDELLDSVRKLQSFDGPIEFNNNSLYMTSVSLLLTGSLMFFYFNETNYRLDLVHIISSCLVFFLGFVPLFIAGGRKDNIANLSKYIFNKDAHQDNNISVLSLKSPMIKSLTNRFLEFDRGNHSREFRSAYSSSFAGELHKFDYSLYHFHWVNSRTVTTTSTDANGNTTISTRTEYDHYDRYGIVLDFNYAKSISVISDGKIRNKTNYKTASISFSEKFAIGAISEMDASKFLKPSVVEAIEKASKNFKQLNIEIDETGLMCISFKDDNVFYSHSNLDILNPDEFIVSLEGHTELPKLRYLEGFIVELMNQLDSNF